MFKGKKRLKIASVLSIALSATAAHADGAAVDNNIKVFVPNLKPAYEVNLGVLWLKPGASNLNYVILNNELPIQSPMWYEQELTPSYTAAFDLGIRRIFPNSGADLSLDWTHLYSSTSETTVAPNDTYFLGPDFEIGPDGLSIRQANGNVKFRYDIVNLDAGQYVNFGERVRVRFFGGLSTGSLKEQVTSTYSGNVTGGGFPGPFSTTQRVSSEFFGIGPRLGLSGNVYAGYGFSVSGEAAASALIGSIDSLSTYSSSSQELLSLYGQNVNYQKIKDQAVYQVVPGFSAKFAVDYMYAYNANTLLAVAAGYQAAVYMNAISQYTPATLVDGEGIQTGGIFVETMSHRLSNYTVQGPFLNFTLNFS